MSCVALTLLCGSCRNDWTIKDMPPVPAKANGAGYVSGFEADGASLIIPVEVPADGEYTILIKGRASLGDTPGEGVVSTGSSSASFTLGKAYEWNDATVKLNLKAGVNDMRISKGSGNGLFQIDYIELQ